MAQDEQNPYGFDYDPNWRTGGVQQNESASPPRVDPSYKPPITTPPEEIAQRYGFDQYDPNWRNAQAAPEEDDYGWGITTAFMRGFERLRALPDVAQGDYEELAQHMGNLQNYELSEHDRQRMEELQNTDGFWGAVGYYLKNRWRTWRWLSWVVSRSGRYGCWFRYRRRRRQRCYGVLQFGWRFLSATRC